MREPLAFGAAVTLRAQPDRIGLIAELRSSDCRVAFLREARSAWLPLRDVRPAPPEALRGSLEETVASLLALLSATELEVDRRSAGRWLLIATHGAITPDTVDALRSRLGARLRACVIRPAGMSRMQTVVEFTADDAGDGSTA
jgi:hypothetical protein